MEENATDTNLLQENESSSLLLELTRVQGTHQNLQESQTTISTQQKQESESKNDSKCSSSKTHQPNHEDKHVGEEGSTGGGGDVAGEVVVQGGEEPCGRERLKRHKIEVAGTVWIPDIWGQEELLKDWIDCNAFDSTLVSGGLMSARAALVQEGRRANSGRIRIENRCS